MDVAESESEALFGGQLGERFRQRISRAEQPGPVWAYGRWRMVRLMNQGERCLERACGPVATKSPQRAPNSDAVDPGIERLWIAQLT